MGDDDLFGNNSANVIFGGDGLDDLRGRDDDDILSGDDGNDILTGGAGNDVLTGGIGNDTLTANAGDDTLDGGLGNDTLDGGQGNDRYVFNDMPGVGPGEIDSILEAVGPLGGTDTLDFSALTQDVTVDFSGGSAFLARHAATFIAPIRTINTGDFTPAGKRHRRLRRRHLHRQRQQQHVHRRRGQRHLHLHHPHRRADRPRR
ncbi:MAG: hypothetical protein R3C45_03795 [Phycisphaerales bacterium]